jgi:hypothetical protein
MAPVLDIIGLTNVRKASIPFSVGNVIERGARVFVALRKQRPVRGARGLSFTLSRHTVASRCAAPSPAPALHGQNLRRKP